MHHDRPALRADGSWRTAIEGEPGFPDLVLVRAPQIIFAELKTAVGKLSEHQVFWGNQLEHVELAVRAHTQRDFIRYVIWRPKDWTDGTILEALKR